MTSPSQSPDEKRTAGHTPGPWHRNIKPASKYPVIWAGRNIHIAVLALGARHGTSLPEEELEANIDLIASAPALLKQRDDLVAALEAAVDDLIVSASDDEEPEDWTSVKTARTVLAQVRSARTGEP